MSDFVRVSIPIVWVIVSTLVGLALYRFSSTRVETRWVRVSGAGATFVLAFILLYRVTPQSLLVPDEVKDWRAVQQELDQLDVQIPATRSQCLSTKGQAQCVKNQLDCMLAIEKLQTEINDLHSIVAGRGRKQ